MTSTRSRPARPRRRPGRKSLTGVWLAFLTPVAAIGLLVAVAGLTGGDPPAAEGDTAVDFAVADTAGGTVVLGDILADGDALLYFSMGVGCDGCFLQIPEIAGELAARNVELVPIMPGRPDWLAAEAARRGSRRRSARPTRCKSGRTRSLCGSPTRRSRRRRKKPTSSSARRSAPAR